MRNVHFDKIPQGKFKKYKWAFEPFCPPHKMFDEHKKDGKLKVSRFRESLAKFGEENLETTDHTFFRLSEKQRKIYTEKELKEIIFNNKPLEVIIQKNNNYAAIYNYKNKFLKIIFDFSINKVYIVTFYILNKYQEKNIKK